VTVKFDLVTFLLAYQLFAIWICVFLSQAKISVFVEQPHAPMQTNYILTSPPFMTSVLVLF
jgi:hypothetical protein